MKKTAFFVVFSAFYSSFSQGIKDTTIVLKEVAKVEKSVTIIIPPVNQFVRLENDNKGVSEYLKKQESFFIKNYGQGGLASIAYRGTSAAQNEVYWNDIKINSPFTGQVDANLLQLDINQNVSKTSASNSIGARIFVADAMPKKGIESTVLLRYTSLNSVDVNAGLNYGGKHIYVLATGSFLYAKNDFRVPDRYGINAWKKQTNALVLSGNARATLGYKFNDKNDLSTSFWYSHNNRQIPALITQNQPSGQSQYDRSVRALMRYNGGVKDFSFVLRTSFLSDVLNYTDTAIKMNTHNRAMISRNEVVLNYCWERIHTTAQVAAKYDYEQVATDTNGLASPKHRNIAEIREHIVYKKGSPATRSFEFKGTAYQTVYQKKVIPTFTVIAIYDQKTKDNVWHNVQLMAARTLRIPSMNDLYWSVGGNPNLKPETGWKGDVKWAVYHQYVQTKLTVYGQYTSDWILWTPVNPTVWSPQNMKRVYGCGTEVFASAGWFEEKSVLFAKSDLKREWFAYFIASYNWNRTINMDAISPNDASANKQLIYVPVHKVYTALRGGWRGLAASLEYTFFSKIYTSTDNSQSLDGYGLMDIHLSYEWDIKGQKITPSFGVCNVLDAQYQTMPNRAMPGRYYEVLLRFNLKG